MASEVLELIYRGKDEVTKVSRDAQKSVEKVDKAANDAAKKGLRAMQSAAKGTADALKFTAKATAAVTASVVGMTVAASTMAKKAGAIEQVRADFISLSFAMGSTANEAMASLREASQGLASDFELMRSGSQLMSMGLVSSNAEMKRVIEVASRLGDQTASVSENVENFSLLLANQSVQRLDTFGIASGKVRERIEQLQKANEGMTRETAFMAATMEEAEKSMEVLGERQDTAGNKVRKMEARFANFRDEALVKMAPHMLRFIEQVEETTKKVSEFLIPKIAKAQEVFERDMLPVLRSVSEYVRDEVIPRVMGIVESLGRLMRELGPVGEKIMDFTTAVLVPLVRDGLKVALDITRGLIDATTGLVRFFKENALAADVLKGAFIAVVSAFSALKVIAFSSAMWSGITAGIAATKGAMLAFTAQIGLAGGATAALTTALMGPAGLAVLGVAAIVAVRNEVERLKGEIQENLDLADEARGRANDAESQFLNQRRAQRAGMSVEEFNALDAAGRAEALRNAPQLAGGARGFGGGMALVGERGPELVTLPRGANVFGTGQTQQIMNDQRNMSRNQTFGDVTINNVDAFEMFRQKLAIGIA